MKYTKTPAFVSYFNSVKRQVEYYFTLTVSVCVLLFECLFVTLLIYDGQCWASYSEIIIYY